MTWSENRYPLFGVMHDPTEFPRELRPAPPAAPAIPAKGVKKRVFCADPARKPVPPDDRKWPISRAGAGLFPTDAWPLPENRYPAFRGHACPSTKRHLWLRAGYHARGKPLEL